MLNLMSNFTVPNAFQMFSVLGEMDYLSVPILNACSKTIIGKSPQMYTVANVQISLFDYNVLESNFFQFAIRVYR